MTHEEALTLALNARDEIHKARRALRPFGFFHPGVLAALQEAEDSIVVAINEQLVLRPKEVVRVAA